MRYAAVGEASFLPVAVADEGTPATDLGPVDQAEAEIDSGAEGTLAMVRPDDLTFRPEERGDAEILSAGYQGVGWLSTVGLPSGHVLAVAEDHLATFAVGTRETVQAVGDQHGLRVSAQRGAGDGGGGSAVQPAHDRNR